MNIQERQAEWEAVKAAYIKEQQEWLADFEKRRQEYNQEFAAWRARMAARRAGRNRRRNGLGPA